MRSTTSNAPSCLVVGFLVPFVLWGLFLSERALEAGCQSKRLSRELRPIPAKLVLDAGSPVSPGKSGIPQVFFEYEVSGKKYTSDQWDSVEKLVSRSGLLNDRVPIASLLSDRSMLAYFNPRNPGESVLDPKPRVPAIELYFGMGFATLALLMAATASLIRSGHLPFNVRKYERGVRFPNYPRGALGPLGFGVAWLLEGAIAWACWGMDPRLGKSFLGILVLHSLIGVAVVVLAIRRVADIAHFSEWSLKIEVSGPNDPARFRWKLRTPARRMRLVIQVVLREGGYRTTSQGRWKVSSWFYDERVQRTLEATPSSEGWEGVLEWQGTVQKPQAQRDGWIQSAIKVEDGSRCVYFALEE
jgi:hypothetical protein